MTESLPSAGVREFWCPLFKARVALIEALEYRESDGWLISAELLEVPLTMPSITHFQMRGRYPQPGAIVVTTDRLLEPSLFRQKEPDEIMMDLRRAFSMPFVLRPTTELVSPEDYRRLYEQTWPSGG